MIEKLKFITITGPKNDIDRVYSKYLMKYPIHFENALDELSETANLLPFVEPNPYKELLGKSEYLVSFLEEKETKSSLIKESNACDLISTLYDEIQEYSKEKDSLQKEIAHLTELKEQIQPFLHININLKSILDFKYLKLRFGRFQKAFYDKFQRYVYPYINSIFYESQVDPDYIYGVYFVTKEEETQIDAIYTSMHFERIFIKDAYEGTPREAFTHLSYELENMEQQLHTLDSKIESTLNREDTALFIAHRTIQTYHKNFDIRKLAALTKDSDSDHTFYILAGFISEADMKGLQDALSDDPQVFLIIHDAKKSVSGPPTKLKNPAIFRPFELFIKMYGMPSYHELDPTIFVALVECKSKFQC